MPYMMKSEDGKVCVHKENPDKSAGALVPGGCHPNRKEAMAHMRALYAATEGGKKELSTNEEEIIFKENDEKSWPEAANMDSWFPYSITTFEELDEWRLQQENAARMKLSVNDLQRLINHTFDNPDISSANKPKAIAELASVFQSRIESEADNTQLSDDLPGEDSDEGKEKGTAEDNNLPDSAFLYVESGGKKDSGGKTEPRSLRHLPYRKADGSIDLPRLRNALSRLGQAATGTSGGEKWLTEATRTRLQARAKKLLAGANKSSKSLVDKAYDFFQALFKEQEPEDEILDRPDSEDKAQDKPLPLFIWKEANGEYRWAARYSNKFRDRDNPPEIIASTSHQKFVEKVDKGLAPMPDLWLWHRKEWKWGTADWIAYDPTGFALAMGKVDKGCEPIAEAMAALPPEDILVSHGMPVKSIVRDPNDPTVIIEHETAEISPLPSWAAANELTSFSILKEEPMTVPVEKRTALIAMGIPEERLKALEDANSAAAKKAQDKGIESKETAPEPAAVKTETPAESAPSQTKDAPPETPEPASPSTPSIQEFADAVANTIAPRLTAIDERFTKIDEAIAALNGEVKALKDADDSKIAKQASKIPAASLGAILQRAIGAEGTMVDGRSTLAKSKPDEARDESSGDIGFMTVDRIIKESDHRQVTQ